VSRYTVVAPDGTELDSSVRYWEACTLLRWHDTGGHVLDNETGEIVWSLCTELDCDCGADHR